MPSKNMTIYDLSLLFLGVLLIGLLFSRYDVGRPRTLVLLLLSVGLFLVIFFSIHHYYYNTCVILTGNSIDDVKSLVLSWGAAAPLMSILLMTLQAVVAPLPAFLITAANGIVFGVYWGTVISWTGAMSGALLSFWLSRMFYKTFSKKVRSRRKGLEFLERLESRYGFKVILTARLLPFVSFDVISYAAGLSTIGTPSFVAATGLGMLPATIVYTAFGSEMERFSEYSSRLFSFSLLAVLALMGFWIVRGVYKRRSDNPPLQIEDVEGEPPG